MPLNESGTKPVEITQYISRLTPKYGNSITLTGNFETPSFPTFCHFATCPTSNPFKTETTMSNSGNTWHKPNVTIQNEAIDIRDKKHSLKLGLAEVSKMYISKHKAGYFSSLLGLMWFPNDGSYDLHIQTKHAEEIKIRIKGFQRQYYINLIARVRSQMIV